MSVQMHKVVKSNRRKWRIILTSIGIILASCCVCIGAAAIVNSVGLLNTATPTMEGQAIDSNATIQAAISNTLTSAPSSTPSPTNTTTSTPTAAATFTAIIPDTGRSTNIPANTFTATSTLTPTRSSIPTFTKLPALPTFDPMQGVTAICNDGTYSYSQHSRGTCSHHGGVREWIHKPPT